MFANFATALPAGAAMTFLLLFGMHSLIAMQPGAAVEAIPRPKIDFRPTIEEQEVQTQETKIEKIQKPVPLPPTAPTEFERFDGPGITFTTQNPPTTPTNDLIYNSGFSDGPLVAIVRVAPTYPTDLITRNIEGWVTVIFDVLPDGTVTNIAVLDSSHHGFERSAIRAASRFKFKARVVDGVPQPSSGIQYRFTYEIDK